MTKRQELTDDKVRSGYYNMTDGYEQLIDAIGEQKALQDDGTLQQLMDELDTKLSELNNHLNENYLWD